MITALKHMNRRDAERLAPDRDAVIVSITDLWRADARLDAANFRGLLRLRFADVDEGIVIRSDREPIWGLPTEQAVEIVHWLDQWHAKPYPLRLFAHCEGGISRSAAVAQFASVRYRIPLGEGTSLANRLVLYRLNQAAQLLAGDNHG